MLVRNIEDLLAAQEKGSLCTRFAGMAEASGFSSISYVALRAGSDDNGGVIDFFSTAPANFLSTYQTERFILVDPVVSRALVSTSPFLWSQCSAFGEAFQGRSGPKPIALRILQAAMDYGYPEGFVVPTHTIHGGESIRGFVTFFWPEGRRAFDLTSGVAGELRVLAKLFHEKFLDLARIGRTDDPGSDVSARERECLIWTAKGKSAGDIAGILGISARTVEHHLFRAAGKLGAANRVQAVVKAIQRGLILP